MNPKPKNKNPKHRTMSFRKARLMREEEENNKPRLDCGCIDHNDDAFVGCESCRYKSCLDCHHIDSTPVNVDDWKCKEGYGCKSHYNCTRCGHMGENNLVHEVGMVCDACMTKDDWRVWDLENRNSNPDSYPCVKCSKDATENYLVPEVGMVCDGCMTVADLDAWHAHNKLVNPDSYDDEEASE